MTCILDRPTPRALFDRIKGNFEANVLGGYNVVPESVEWYVISNDYAMAEAFYSTAEAQWKARDPRFACCDDLYAMAARDGIYPKPAGFAQGYVRVTGNAGANVPDPLEVVIGDQHYVATGTIPDVMPNAKYFDVRVKAIVPGVEGNVALKNTTGSLANNSAGIDNTVTPFGSSFCGGSAAEDCEDFRTRYIDRLAYKPIANAAWLEAKMFEWPCVTRVVPRGNNCCTYVSREGCGCAACGCNTCTQDLNFYPLFDDTFDCGIPPQCVIDDMNDWLFGSPQGRGLGQAPVGICGMLYAPDASMIDVRVTGLACSTPAEQAKIRRRIRDVFKLAVPSSLFTRRSIELAIAQVTGTSENFEVVFEDNTGNMVFDDCGNMDSPCDVMPCLDSITFVGADINEGAC